MFPPGRARWKAHAKNGVIVSVRLQQEQALLPSDGQRGRHVDIRTHPGKPSRFGGNTGLVGEAGYGLSRV